MAYPGPSVIGLTGGTGLLSPYLEVTGWLHVFGVNDPAKLSVANATSFGTLDFWVDTTTDTTNVIGTLKVNGAIITPFDPTQPLLLHGPGQMFTVANADESNQVFFINTDTSTTTSTGITILSGTDYTDKFSVKTAGGTALFNIDTTVSTTTISSAIVVPAFSTGFVLSNSGGTLSSSETVGFASTFSANVTVNGGLIANDSLFVYTTDGDPLFTVDSGSHNITVEGTLILYGEGEGFALVNGSSQVSSSPAVPFDVLISGTSSLTKFQVRDGLGSLIFGVDTLTPQVTIYGAIVIPGLTANAIVQTNSIGGLFASSYIAAPSVGRSAPMVLENSNASVGTVCIGFLCQTSQQGYLEFTPTNFNLSDRLQIINTYAAGVDQTLQLTNLSVVGGTGVSIYATVNSGGSPTNGTLSFISSGWNFDTSVTVNAAFTQTGSGAVAFAGATLITNTLTQTGGGVIALSGATTIANTLTQTGGGAFSISGATSIANTLTQTGGGAVSISGATSIANTLTQTGGGAVSISGPTTIKVSNTNALLVQNASAVTMLQVNSSLPLMTVGIAATFSGNAIFNALATFNNSVTVNSTLQVSATAAAAFVVETAGSSVIFAVNTSTPSITAGAATTFNSNLTVSTTSTSAFKGHELWRRCSLLNRGHVWRQLQRLHVQISHKLGTTTFLYGDRSCQH